MWILLPPLRVRCTSVLTSTDSLSKNVYWISLCLFHLLTITSSDYNLQCLSVSIHYLLLQLLIQIRTEWLLHMVQLLYQLSYVRCLHLMYLKMASTVRIELTHGLLESLSPNPWNIGGYTINGSLCRCCPGYSWMKAKWLSWLSNRPLNGASVRIRTPNSTFVALRDKSIFTTEA